MPRPGATTTNTERSHFSGQAQQIAEFNACITNPFPALSAALFLVASGFAAAQTPCAALRSASLPYVTVTAAEFVPAGPLQGPAAPGPAARAVVPPHCRVAAVLAPSADSHIEIELWLPPAESWNGKFEAVGNGGWAGSISFGAGSVQPGGRNMASALADGYATASNDTGHKGGGGASFALGHPEKLRDFADRAVHEMVVASKALIAAHYGSSPRFSYWNGCSTGGRQGLMEAQRYPEDFDGIVAGAPANYWTHLMAGIVWAAQAEHEGQPGNLPAEKLRLLHEAALRACDALDGVKDGLLEDPRKCRFDPGTLVCRGAESADCLTKAQVETARRMYTGAVDPRTGGQIYPGLPPGSELGWDPVKGLQPLPIAESHFQYIVFRDPQWDFRRLNFDSDIALTDRTDNGLINATDPDLRRFFARGGKLIQYHGWNDQQIAAENSINYFDSVVARLGGQMKVTDSYRLFMAPGMMHCSGGEGPNQFNAMAALERWREAGIAPQQMLAVHTTNTTVEMTRPLCVYPEVAVYKAVGSVRDAASFACGKP